VTRSWLRRYELLYPKGATAGAPGNWLATVVLTSDGHFFANSDFGSYGHHWRGVSGDFRLSLLRFGDSYVISKLARPSEYDAKATLQSVQSYLADVETGDDDIDESAKKERELLAEHNDLETVRDLYLWLDDTEIDDAAELIVDRYPHDARLFVEHVLPALRAAIRAEVDIEDALANMPAWDDPGQADHLADMMAEVSR
jgi:hypothetical protein